MPSNAGTRKIQMKFQGRSKLQSINEESKRRRSKRSCTYLAEAGRVLKIEHRHRRCHAFAKAANGDHGGAAFHSDSCPSG
jgi:hypothetical protein